MAEKLSTFDFSAPSAITPATEKAVYPWNEWLDGDIWKLTEGEDFDTHPLMMERIIRTRATARGATVRMRHQSLNGAPSPRSRKAYNPFGIIVLQCTNKVGPAEMAANGAERDRKKAEAAAKRAAKKAEAAKEAQEFVAKIKPSKSAAPKSAKPVSKRPAKAPK